MAIIKKQADGSFFVEKRKKNKSDQLLFGTLGTIQILIKDIPSELHGKDIMFKIIPVERGMQ